MFFYCSVHIVFSLTYCMTNDQPFILSIRTKGKCLSLLQYMVVLRPCNSFSPPLSSPSSPSYLSPSFPPLLSLSPSFTLTLSPPSHPSPSPSQTSMTRKQVENVAKKKLDNLLKESKIRDREDPDSFTIATLSPSGKPTDQSASKVTTTALWTRTGFIFYTLSVCFNLPGLFYSLHCNRHAQSSTNPEF